MVQNIGGHADAFYPGLWTLVPTFLSKNKDRKLRVKMKKSISYSYSNINFFWLVPDSCRVSIKKWQQYKHIKMNKTMLDSALFRKFGIVGLTQYAYSVCKKIILFALSEKLTKDSLPAFYFLRSYEWIAYFPTKYI